MIIAITGKKGHGKSTVANTIASRFGFDTYAFADPIKEIVQIIFDWTDAHTDGALKEVIDPRWGVSPRQIMQDIGTDWGQHHLCETFPLFKEVVGRQLWVRRFEAFYERETALYQRTGLRYNVAVSDLRFHHEEKGVHGLGGLVIKVVRPGMDDNDEHESERLIDRIRCDNMIVNDGSMEELRDAATEMVSEMLGVEPDVVYV